MKQRRQTLMTIRVSRDGGRTWTTTKRIREGDSTLGVDVTNAWPPCRCARCKPQRERESELLRRELKRWGSLD